MNIPQRTELEEQLVKENTNLRNQIVSLDKQLLDSITDVGIRTQQLQKKSELVAELYDLLDERNQQIRDINEKNE